MIAHNVSPVYLFKYLIPPKTQRHKISFRFDNTDRKYSLDGLEPDDLLLVGAAVECFLVNWREISTEKNDSTSLKRSDTFGKDSSRAILANSCKLQDLVRRGKDLRQGICKGSLEGRRKRISPKWQVEKNEQLL